MSGCKAILIGPPGAGKTTFFNRSTKGDDFHFNAQHTRTDLADERILTRVINGKSITFAMVDTVGGSVFGEYVSIGPLFRDVRIVLCLFDASNPLSFTEWTKKDRFENLRTQLYLKNISIDTVDFIMVGTKCDLPSNVPDEQIEDFVNTLTTVGEDEHQCIHYFRLPEKYFRCSAKTGFGVAPILDHVAQIIDSSETRPRELIIKLENVPEKEKEKRKKGWFYTNCGGGAPKSNTKA